jgi:hypothetical protein
MSDQNVVKEGWVQKRGEMLLVSAGSAASRAGSQLSLPFNFVYII